MTNSRKILPCSVEEKEGWSEIPLDIIREILSRLPVKSLLRFKCVCKCWYSLINDPYFIHLHLSNSLLVSSLSNRFLVYEQDNHLLCLDDSDFPTQLSKLNFPKLSWPNSTEFDTPKLMWLHKLIGKGEEEINIVDSCNGLVCASVHWSGVSNDNLKGFIVSNPSTCMFKQIPRSSDMLHVECYIWYGFGHDSHNEDYKIVAARSGGDMFLYSLKSSTWRWLASSLPLDRWRCWFAGSNGRYYNNMLHFEGQVERESNEDGNEEDDNEEGVKRIMCFDLSSEEWGDELGFPNYPSSHKETELLNFGVLDGSVYAVFRVVEDRTMDVWIMKEYGVEGSWTKLFHIDQKVWCLPMAYSKTDPQLVLIRCVGKGIVWYNIKESTIESFDFGGFTFGDVVYKLGVGSLVMIPGSTPLTISKIEDLGTK